MSETIWQRSYDTAFVVNKNPTRCKSIQIFIYRRVTLHVSGVTAPIIRSTKNGMIHIMILVQLLTSNVPIRPRWREVAVPVLWPVPEATVTVFSTPDDGCCDTRNMLSDFAVNKYLHTVASGWVFIDIRHSTQSISEKMSQERWNHQNI